MSQWKKQQDNHGRNEWVRGNYCVTENKRAFDERDYFCYYRLNFIGARLTPEQAMEFCDAHDGKK